MFKEEKVINGVLCWRSTPGGEWAQYTPEQLTAKIAELGEDKARLDFLDDSGDGSAWVARESGTGRGYRLHNTSRGIDRGARATVREAIDVARGIERDPRQTLRVSA